MIYVLSGGGGKAYAFIIATYPAGSTCTCTDGSKTLKLKDTSGKGVFHIPYAATWAVKCTDGTNTKSASVNITSEGQSKSVALAYWNGELYDSGNEFTDVTGGWVAAALGHSTGGWNQVTPTLTKGSASMTVKMPNYEGNGCIHMTKSFNMSSYKILKATISAYSAGNGITDQNYMCVYKQGNNPYSASAARVSITKIGTYTLDISSLSGNYDVAFGCANNEYGTVTQYTITKVWLE